MNLDPPLEYLDLIRVDPDETRVYSLFGGQTLYGHMFLTLTYNLEEVLNQEECKEAHKVLKN